MIDRFNFFILKAMRKLHEKFRPKPIHALPYCEVNADKVSCMIYSLLVSDNSCMIARFGSTELNCLVNYVGVKNGCQSWIKYIQGNVNQWWWNEAGINQMQTWSGFFPANAQAVTRFSELMLKDIPLVNLLGSWLPDEVLFDSELKDAAKVNLELLNPYFSGTPWTQALEGKKVLVIHPFACTIEAQYKKRNLLFKNNLLPEFELKTIKAVQSIAGEKTEFVTWFDALEHMKAQMDRIDYDICLIGCGAYGFSLAAHAKRMGKKGFHLGGSLQLLFGIRGKRWEDPNYNPNYNYAALMNEHWVKPSEEERPVAAKKVEDACYW